MRPKRALIGLAVAAVASIVLLSVSPAGATAPGENGRIAFRRYLNSAHSSGAIFTTRPDGTGARQVTHPRPGVLHAAADWSPDGRWIAFVRGTLDDGRMFKIHPDGTHRAPLSETCTGSCFADLQPAFSPSGEQVVFTRFSGEGKGGLVALYVMRADGTHVSQVTQQGASLAVQNRFEDADPQWSSAGNRVVFERQDNHRGAHHAIFTVRPDGTGLRRVTEWPLDATLADWSPDGRWILFISHEDPEAQNNIFVAHPDGSDLHRVTHTFGGTYHWYGSTFSPDGRFIVSSRTPGHGKPGNADVFVMNVDGSGLRNVTNSFAWDSGPDWGSRPT
jgi:TolB protein